MVKFSIYLNRRVYVMFLHTNNKDYDQTVDAQADLILSEVHVFSHCGSNVFHDLEAR